MSFETSSTGHPHNKHTQNLLALGPAAEGWVNVRWFARGHKSHQVTTTTQLWVLYWRGAPARQFLVRNYDLPHTLFGIWESQFFANGILTFAGQLKAVVALWAWPSDKNNSYCHCCWDTATALVMSWGWTDVWSSLIQRDGLELRLIYSQLIIIQLMLIIGWLFLWYLQLFDYVVGFLSFCEDTNSCLMMSWFIIRGWIKWFRALRSIGGNRRGGGQVIRCD